MGKELFQQELLDNQKRIFKGAYYSGEQSYWELQSLIRDLQELAQSNKVGNLHMYGGEFAAYHKWLGDNRSLKSNKKFNEVKERILYDLSTVRIMDV